jgi:hypothetical protein
MEMCSVRISAQKLAILTGFREIHQSLQANIEYCDHVITSTFPVFHSPIIPPCDTIWSSYWWGKISHKKCNELSVIPTVLCQMIGERGKWIWEIVEQNGFAMTDTTIQHFPVGAWGKLQTISVRTAKRFVPGTSWIQLKMGYPWEIEGKGARKASAHPYAMLEKI